MLKSRNTLHIYISRYSDRSHIGSCQSWVCEDYLRRRECSTIESNIGSAKAGCVADYVADKVDMV